MGQSGFTAFKLFILLATNLRVQAQHNFKPGRSFEPQCERLTSDADVVQKLLSHDGYPDTPYQPNTDKCWTLCDIAENSYHVIALEFQRFDVEVSRCDNDILTLYDGSTFNDYIIAVLCGQETEPQYKSNDQCLTLHFTTNGEVEEAGFELDYITEFALAGADENDDLFWQVTFPIILQSSIWFLIASSWAIAWCYCTRKHNNKPRVFNNEQGQEISRYNAQRNAGGASWGVTHGIPQVPPPGQVPYGAPPPGAYGAPPNSSYGAPPQGTYGAPPPPAYGAAPPGAYGAPPTGAYEAPPSYNTNNYNNSAAPSTNSNNSAAPINNSKTAEKKNSAAQMKSFYNSVVPIAPDSNTEKNLAVVEI